MNRILLCSVNLLGDTLGITPAIHALRKEHSNAHITLMVQDEPFTRILEHNLDVDEIIYDNGENWDRVRNLDPNNELGHFDFKHLFDITKSWNYCLREGKHMSEGYAHHLGQALKKELTIESRSPVIKFTEEEIEESKKYKGSIVFAPHSASSTVENADGAGNKKWGKSKWISFIRFIKGKYPEFKLVSVGGPKDVKLGWEGVMEYIGNDIRKDAVMVFGCDLCVVLDNGISHLASGVGQNILCLHPRAVPKNFSWPHTTGWLGAIRAYPMGVSVQEMIDEFEKFIEWRK